MTIAELIHRLSHMDVDPNTIVQIELADPSSVSDPVSAPIPCVITGLDVESHPDAGGGPHTVWITVIEDS